MSDDFYIGYQKTAPDELAKWVRRVTLAIGLIVVGAAIAAATFQQPLGNGVYEFGVTRPFEGILFDEPIPHLRLTTPAEEFGAGQAFVLVSRGKYGFPESARQFLNREVRLTGSLIRRGQTAMIELSYRDAIHAIAAKVPQKPESSESLGEVTLTGESVVMLLS